jgi:hypothetical protein
MVKEKDTWWEQLHIEINEANEFFVPDDYEDKYPKYYLDDEDEVK